MPAKPVTVVTTAEVRDARGDVVATIALVPVGGGTQVVNVDGTPEDRVHPLSQRYHVRLLSPDRMISDELRETDEYAEACTLAEKYAAKRNEHAKRVDALAADLKV